MPVDRRVAQSSWRSTLSASRSCGGIRPARPRSSVQRSARPADAPVAKRERVCAHAQRLPEDIRAGTLRTEHVHSPLRHPQGRAAVPPVRRRLQECIGGNVEELSRHRDPVCNARATAGGGVLLATRTIDPVAAKSRNSGLLGQPLGHRHALAGRGRAHAAAHAAATRPPRDAGRRRLPRQPPSQVGRLAHPSSRATPARRWSSARRRRLTVTDLLDALGRAHR